MLEDGRGKEEERRMFLCRYSIVRLGVWRCRTGKHCAKGAAVAALLLLPEILEL